MQGSVHVVMRHAIVEVRCVNVVIGVHIVVLSVPLVVVRVVPIFLVVQLIQLTLFSQPFFTYVFTVFSRHFRCSIYTGRTRAWIGGWLWRVLKIL